MTDRMKILVLCAAVVLLSSCADFVQGFAEGYARAQSQPLVYAESEPEAEPTPDYTIHSALVTQIGQPPKIITYNQNSALITQIGHPPIIITGN